MTLGIVEECGELWEALHQFKHEEVKNALADIVVFSMQLASFEKFNWVENLLQHQRSHVSFDENGLGIQAGRLCHHILKRAQGLGKKEDHLKAIKKALAGVGIELTWIAGQEEVDWVQNYIDVVEGEVLKRNREERMKKYVKSKGK